MLVCLSEADSVGLFVRGRLTCMMEQLDSGDKTQWGDRGGGGGSEAGGGGGGLRWWWWGGGVLISQGGSYVLL